MARPTKEPRTVLPRCRHEGDNLLYSTFALMEERMFRLFGVTNRTGAQSSTSSLDTIHLLIVAIGDRRVNDVRTVVTDHALHTLMPDTIAE